MDEKRITAVQDLLLRRLKDMPLGRRVSFARAGSPGSGERSYREFAYCLDRACRRQRLEIASDRRSRRLDLRDVQFLGLPWSGGETREQRTVLAHRHSLRSSLHQRSTDRPNCSKPHSTSSTPRAISQTKCLESRSKKKTAISHSHSIHCRPDLHFGNLACRAFHSIITTICSLNPEAVWKREHV